MAIADGKIEASPIETKIRMRKDIDRNEYFSSKI